MCEELFCELFVGVVWIDDYMGFGLVDLCDGLVFVGICVVYDWCFVVDYVWLCEEYVFLVFECCWYVVYCDVVFCDEVVGKVWLVCFYVVGFYVEWFCEWFGYVDVDVFEVVVCVIVWIWFVVVCCVYV